MVYIIYDTIESYFTTPLGHGFPLIHLHSWDLVLLKGIQLTARKTNRGGLKPQVITGF